MVPVWGGRAAPPVKAAIFVNPAAGASTPVWATAAVRDTTAARAPATAPLGVHGYPLRCLLPHYLPRQLELVVSVVVGRNRAVGATSAQSLELCCRCTHCIHCRYCFFFCLAASSSAIASLAALAAVAAVSAAARSLSSAMAPSASCRCYTLKATER
jgi:hypothetical protein